MRERFGSAAKTETFRIAWVLVGGWISDTQYRMQMTNRTGLGAIGSITSAVTVAASSFTMTITDPATLLDDIDASRLKDLLGSPLKVEAAIHYVEPASNTTPEEALEQPKQPTDYPKPVINKPITGKIQNTWRLHRYRRSCTIRSPGRSKLNS